MKLCVHRHEHTTSGRANNFIYSFQVPVERYHLRFFFCIRLKCPWRVTFNALRTRYIFRKHMIKHVVDESLIDATTWFEEKV